MPRCPVMFPDRIEFRETRVDRDPDRRTVRARHQRQIADAERRERQGDVVESTGRLSLFECGFHRWLQRFSRNGEWAEQRLFVIRYSLFVIPDRQPSGRDSELKLDSLL